MNVLVDTGVWSLALRRREPADGALVGELIELINEQRVVLIGPVRQELLSGIRGSAQFLKLRDHLSAFPDMPLKESDYESAAEFFNLCRAKGVQGSNTDFLICATAVNNELAILTADKDFSLFSKYLPVRLHQVRIS